MSNDNVRRGKRAGKKAAKGGSGKTLLVVGCLGCGGITAVGVVASAILFALFVWPFADGPAKKRADGGVVDNVVNKVRPAQVTMASLEKVELGMTQGEVEAILGSGTSVSEADVARAQERAHTKVGNDWKKLAQTSQVKNWAEWRSGSDVIHIGYRQSKLGDLATLRMGVFSSLKIPGATEYHLDAVPASLDLAAQREAKTRAENLFADPKWAKGPEIRQLFVGRWISSVKGGVPYEFSADGSVKTKDLTAKDTNGRYQFLTDDQVKISLPNMFLQGQMSDVTYKVLITQRELMLAPQNGNTFVAGELYRRGKGTIKK